MDGWMDGWIDGWMDGWMDGWSYHVIIGYITSHFRSDWWLSVSISRFITGLYYRKTFGSTDYQCWINAVSGWVWCGCGYPVARSIKGCVNMNKPTTCLHSAKF